MARERTPEGKRVVIPVRVSEPKAAAIDAARGDTARSVWVEGAIDAELARLDAASRPAPAVRQGKPDDCPHPKARVIKGFCYACGKPTAR